MKGQQNSVSCGMHMYFSSVPDDTSALCPTARGIATRAGRVTERRQLLSYRGYHILTMQRGAQASTNAGNGLRPVQPCNSVKKNLDFNPTTCGCQQHLQKKEKTHKPLCIADCKLFLLIHYRLFQINSAYSFLYLCKISTFDPANIYVHILLAGTVFCTECNKVLFTGP